MMAGAFASTGAAGAAAGLDVVVTNVRNDKGMVRVAVCSEAEFLKPTCVHTGHAPARAGEVVVHVANVPPGRWAAQAFHDENGSGVIERSLLGLPSKGLGFSNDARMMFGPPSFKSAAFELSAAGGRIQFSLRYF